MPDMIQYHRIRITYAVGYPLQYIGQLDMQSVWERVFRRAVLPIAYSQGFHPQPKLHLACALPLGFQSQCELLDVWLTEPVPLNEIRDRLSGKEQPGLKILNVAEVPLSLPALQTTTLSAEYQCELASILSIESIGEKIEGFLHKPQAIRERRGKTYDLRPLILEIRLKHDPPDHTQIWMRLKTQEGATGRPDEVLSELGVDPTSTRITRISLQRQDG
jgi:radical SAM-linked protein